MSICKKPDRDVAGLICGYPLPCPYHTVVIHEDKQPPTIEIPATIAPEVTPERLKTLKEIAKAIDEDNPM